MQIALKFSCKSFCWII